MVRSGPKASAVWLAPSLSDVLFAALLLWLVLFTIHSDGITGLLGDANTGYHIRTGDYILQHKAIPRRDIFSFSRAGEPWFAWEWLSAVLFSLLYHAGGMKGLIVATATIIAAANIILLRHMVWRGANFLAVIVVLHLGIGASSIHYLARPHVFTLLFMAISLWLIDRDHRQPSKRIAFLLPLAALWANLHGGFLALIACLGVVAVGSFIKAVLSERGYWRADSLSMAKRYALLTIGCLAATSVNPYGFAVHLHAIPYLRAAWIAKVVQEFQSPSFHSPESFYFEVLLFAGVAMAAWLLKQKQIVPALLILFWAHAALTSVRHISIYFLVLAPMLSREATALWDRWAASAKRGSLRSILDGVSREHTHGLDRTTLWAPALVVALSLFRFGWDWPTDFPAGKFPVAMVTQYAGPISSARIFTTDSWGDYLTFRNYPKQRVFIDGRSDFFGKEISDEYLDALNGHYAWNDVMKRYDFNMALAPTASAIASLLRLSPDWRILAQDSQAVLFQRTR